MPFCMCSVALSMSLLSSAAAETRLVPAGSGDGAVAAVEEGRDGDLRAGLPAGGTVIFRGEHDQGNQSCAGHAQKPKTGAGRSFKRFILSSF